MIIEAQGQGETADRAPIRRLVVACGNTLRGDDGVGWKIATELLLHPSYLDPHSARAEILVTQQLLPEHAESIRHADIVVFVDCSAMTPSGHISSLSVQPADQLPRILTHHLDPASLLRLALDLYETTPSRATLVTVGGESFELTEELSPAVAAAIPAAIDAIEEALR